MRGNAVPKVTVTNDASASIVASLVRQNGSAVPTVGDRVLTFRKYLCKAEGDNTPKMCRVQIGSSLPGSGAPPVYIGSVHHINLDEI
jgi:hypothetical protein